MSVLLQISDPHFGTEQPHVVAALTRLVVQLRPSLIVLSGDITQRARRAQFAKARTFMDGLNTPFVAIPGNHDIPLFNLAARIFAPYGNYRRAFGENLEPRFESQDFLVICANTTRANRHKDGEISSRQISVICERLQSAAARQLRIVVTHQPVHAIRAGDKENLLHGHEAAVRAWSEAGADIVMGGHIHLPYIRPLTERFVDLPRKTWVVQAGTSLSHRVRGSVPNSVNLLRHSADALECSVERWDFDANSAAFGCFSTEQLKLDRRPH
jgi:3',5'-cyclic AMP phosphodiesterase CpdA